MAMVDGSRSDGKSGIEGALRRIVFTRAGMFWLPLATPRLSENPLTKTSPSNFKSLT